MAVGSGIGGLATIEEQHKILLERGCCRVCPFFIPAIIINLASGHISIKYGAKGPNIATVTACATGPTPSASPCASSSRTRPTS